MDGLEQQLNQILSDPNSMKQLQGMISSLGLGGGESGQGSKPAPPPPAPAGPDLSALAGMLGSLGGGRQPQAAPGPDALGMAAKLAPIMSRISQEDDSTRLLMALRPLLGEERRRKIDEAVKILRLMRLLPLLRDMGGTGLFGEVG